MSVKKKGNLIDSPDGDFRFRIRRASRRVYDLHPYKGTKKLSHRKGTEFLGL